MSYQEELNRLQQLITAEGSSEEQREKARAVKNKLIDDSIEQALGAFEGRTEEYGQLVGKLKDVIDKIAANQLTTVMNDLGEVAQDIKNAAISS